MKLLGGQTKLITNMVELQSFVFLEDVIKFVVKMERNLKHGTNKQSVS